MGWREDYRNPLTPFQKALLALDVKLTGTNSFNIRQAEHNIRQNRIDVEEFVWSSQPYYLADGGYSRVWCKGIDGHIFLSSVSRKEVFAAWENAGKEVEDVEVFTKAFIKDFIN